MSLILLWRCISYCAIDARFLQAHLAPRLQSQPGLGCAEVHQPYLAGVLVQDQVGRLDVVVHHRIGFHPGQVLQHLADLHSPAGHIFWLLWPFSGQPLLQVLPIYELHDDVVAPLLREEGVDVGDAGVLEGGQHPRLVLKALFGPGYFLGFVRVEVVQHFLDHAQPVEGFHVFRQVKRAHPSPIQRPHDAICPALHRLAGLQGNPAWRSTPQ